MKKLLFITMLLGYGVCSDPTLLEVDDATGLWAMMSDPDRKHDRQPSNLVVPYDGPGWGDDTWLTYETIFEIGPQGQGLWSGYHSMAAGSTTEEWVDFDLGSSQTVTEIRLYRYHFDEYRERFPKRIQAMEGGSYGVDDSDGWTELGSELTLSEEDIPDDPPDYFSIDISDTPFTGRYLRLRFKGNFRGEIFSGGNSGNIELAAVQFFYDISDEGSGDPEQFQPQTKSDLQTAVDLWVSDNDSALATHGEINTWDVSLITDMSGLLFDESWDGYYNDFNGDISSWDVSNVTFMQEMFTGVGLREFFNLKTNYFTSMSF